MIMREDEGCAHITGQFFIVLHQLLVLLVDRQHFADPVGRRLSLDGEGRERERETTNTQPAAVPPDTRSGVATVTLALPSRGASAWSHD